MALIVHKYGGTSMGSVERIRNVARRIAKWHRAGHQMMVVPSAMAGETNRLLELAFSISAQPEPRELDMIAATGEQVSIGLLSLALKALGVCACSYAGWQVPIKTDGTFSKARIIEIDGARVRRDLEAGRIAVIAGFQGVDDANNITTLGRGGSDTSALALAAAFAADECLIYTDVDGVYTADPRIVDQARRLECITCEEMLEMASLGSKVLQTRSVEFAGKYRVKTRVLSSLSDPLMPLEDEMRSGTLMTFEEDQTMEQVVVSGIAHQRDEARIAVLSVPDTPGIAYQILGPVARAHIDIDMIVQNQSVEGRTDFTFTVARSDYARAMDILNASVKAQIGARQVIGDPQVSKVSVIGVGMRSHVGVARTMFRTLAEEGINIQMISTSEIKISVLIDEKYMELAVRALHKAFELERG
ncbi:Aspartokinase (Aspartate kinase) [Candidatus Glomeribacter gigasporarum BEG34]|uniref:Aspartokinase n=1 Tax=Candidatus Glomeribacter gigasporarum BEG34 TaxID=1070319 RepID=G2J9M2_9BURK|nr:aspartate kinase [Candidatus Glomeribacter gigasporarum]CCD29469.1 Aspartokinase (Aspartate kinase) [Candidatus Glomeribacter gigasporarum BEG34]